MGIRKLTEICLIQTKKVSEAAITAMIGADPQMDRPLQIRTVVNLVRPNPGTRLHHADRMFRLLTNRKEAAS